MYRELVLEVLAEELRFEVGRRSAKPGLRLPGFAAHPCLRMSFFEFIVAAI
jgi:hypothetical protein